LEQKRFLKSPKSTLLSFKIAFFALHCTTMIEIGELNFDDIRPYQDDEVPAVIERVLKNEHFYKVVELAYPGMTVDTIQQMMRSCKTVYDFQKNISAKAVWEVLKKTSDELSYGGFENISREHAHLFISNHRDIILDSAILNICLIKEDVPSTETAIGSNLLSSELATDLSKLNKNFVVNRNLAKKDLFLSSYKLSAYIHRAIKDNKNSVWLAQKEGRTKDGLDLTQPGLLKMLTISNESSYADCFQSLNILPMAISYEYDPCDYLKTNEIKILRENQIYEKKPGEDLQSMYTGVIGFKGRIHMQIGAPFNEEIELIRTEQNKNEKIKILTRILDHKIHNNYKLWPGNYIAHHLLYGNGTYSTKYTSEDKTKFELYIEKQLSKIPNCDAVHREILLGIYANPVLSFEQYLSKARY
jgi:hypothetical protein